MLRLALLAAVLAFSTPALAQTAPAGWKLSASPNLWIATSPEAVRLAFYPPDTSRASFIFWFEDEGLRRTSAFGGAVRAQEPARRTSDGPNAVLYAQSRTLVDASGAQTAVLSYAWDTPKGRQMAQIVLPLAVGAQSRAYQAAYHQLTAAWKSGLAYEPKPSG